MDVEKWDWKDWRNWVAIATWVLLPLFIFIGLVPGWSATWNWLGNNSSNIASWVQAVGSIAAIAAGFLVANLQIKSERKAQENNERLKLRDSYLILAHRIFYISTWADSIADSKIYANVLWQENASECDEMIATLQAIPASEYPHPIHYMEIQKLRIFLKGIRHAFNCKMPGKPNDEEMNLLFEEIPAIAKFAKDFGDQLFEESGKYISKVEANEYDKFSDKMRVRIDSLHIVNPFDTGKPQTQQPPAAGK